MVTHTIYKSTLSKVSLDFLIYLLLVIATLAVYWQVRNHEFVNLDDEVYIVHNFHIQEGLTFDSFAWAFTSIHAANWHPLTWLSHMLDVQLYGVKAGRHHMTSLLFHILNTLLLFFVFKRMTGALWPTTFVAALFALHPLHVESVAWVSERKDVLSAFFWMLTMGAYVLYVEHPGVNRYVQVIVFFILGLMAKPMVMTLPFVLLLLDFWPLNRFQFGQLGADGRKQQNSLALRLIWEKIPLFVLAASSGVVTLLAQQNFGAIGSFDTYPLDVRISNALMSYVDYIGKMIWPHNLAVFYPYTHTISWPILAWSSLFFLSFFFLAIKKLKAHPWFAVGWLWYVVTLVPVIGLVQIGSQAMADRYTYIPLIGISIIAAWGIPELMAGWRLKGTASAIMALAFLSVITGMTWIQAGYWRNSVKLFEHALDVTKNNYMAHNSLAAALSAGGRTAQAIHHLHEALRIYPRYVAGHINLGIELSNQGRRAEAIRHFNEALEINPESVGAHINLAVILAIEGRASEAIRHFDKALEINPESYEVHGKLGDALVRMDRLNEAIGHYRQALRINPRFAEVHNNLGITLIRKGKLEEAVAHFRKALRIKPGYVDAQNNLNKTLMLQGNLSSKAN
jgi:Tfp pilus assembly protein PilF